MRIGKEKSLCYSFYLRVVILQIQFISSNISEAFGPKTDFKLTILAMKVMEVLTSSSL